MGRVTVTSFDARTICKAEAHESQSTVSEHAVTYGPGQSQVAQGLARVVGGLALFVACVAASAQVQMAAQDGQSPQSGAEDPFFKDAKAGYHFRTFFMDKENPNGSINEAWAAGGWLFGRTGFWRDTLQLGATYYFSLPVYAPDDKGGTQLLTPDQGSISVLGELYARLRYEKQTLTLYRQEIEMGYPRPAGVRSNRSDLSYVGKLDNRMVPVTYQAALLGGPIVSDSPTIGTLNYWAGYLWDAKPRDSSEFISMGQAIGAKNSGAGMTMAGLQWSPLPGLWTQAWYHQVNDVLNIGFFDFDYVSRLSKESYWRLATQYTSQTSAGGSALTGSSFSTWNWEGYGEFGWQWLTLYGAYSTIGEGQQIRTPFSSGPIYTQMVTRSFTQAGEDTWLLGVAVKLDALAPGLSFWFDVADGRNAVNPNTGAALPDEREYDIGFVWTYREKGSMFDGLRVRLRNRWVYDYGPAGTKSGTDLRLDINWPIPFL
jgi:hypothetical protein